MSTKFHQCLTCNKDFKDATGLRAHRTYMRSIGKIEGHELRAG